jgi:hypothetical protein
MAKYGMGGKKLTKAEMTRLALLRNPKVNILFIYIQTFIPVLNIYK